MRKALPLVPLALAAVALNAGFATAQPSPPPDDAPSSVAVPRGASGAIIKTPDAPEPEPTMPRPITYSPPEYPPDAKAAGIEGMVILALDIDKQGHVTKSVVLEPAGHGFDESALAAAPKLLFEPARRPNGTAIAARIRYRYTFTLKESERAGGAASPSTYAQQKSTAALSGVVLASTGDAPLAGAAVTLVSTTRSGAPPASTTMVTTDEKGAFAFFDVAPGTYAITLLAPGYEALTVDEVLAAGEATEVKYRVLPKGGGLEVSVRGDRPPREVTKRTLEQREILRIPGTNGDAIKAIQNLPGVARSTLLIVRGSAPQDTQVFVDGTQVPLIYHFGGLSSVVPTEVLEKIDFYPGNFSAQYGRLQGGIVDVGMRSPKAEYHGIAQIDLIDGRLLVEGPIPFLKDWTFLAAGRRSWLDTWAGPVLKSAGAGVTEAPVYYDYQFMVATHPTPESAFRIAYFGSDDAFKAVVDKPSASQPTLSGSLGYHTAFQRIQARYTQDLANGDHMKAVVALGQDGVDFSLGSIFFILDYKSLSGRVEYSSKVGKGMTLNTGLDITGGRYDVNVRLPPMPRPGQPPNQPFATQNIPERRTIGSFVEPAGYAELEISPMSRLRIVPGLRFDYLNMNDKFEVSPRFNARFDVHQAYPRTTVKAGAGVFHQPPQPQELLAPFGNSSLNANRAIQYAVGVEQEFSKQVEASVEGFYKQLDSQIVSTVSASGAGAVYSNTGTGYVVGSEVLLKYNPDARFFGWLAYTLSRSVRRDGPSLPERPVSWDQTHILTVLGSYRLGHGWEFGARFRLVSGNLITPNVCDATSTTCDATRTNALFHAPSGTYTAIPYGSVYSERLPIFHQLDIRLDRVWKFKTWQFSAYLDLQNTYNNQNVEGVTYNYNYTTRQYVTGLPIIPSIGLRGEF